MLTLKRFCLYYENYSQHYEKFSLHYEKISQYFEKDYISLPKPHPGMIFNEPFKSPENLTPEQSEGDPEPVELLSDEPSDWAAWEFANDQAEQ